MPARPLIPHIALPVRMIAGRVAAVEQDTLDELATRVEVVVRYQPGDLDHDPEFGVTDETFRQGGPDPDVYLAAIGRFEPDVDALAEADPDRLAELTGRVRIDLTGPPPTEEE